MNLNFEKQILRKGYDLVIGIDEVGRGALAGPVVAVALAVIFSNEGENPKLRKFLSKVKDSKQLSPKKRQELYKKLTSYPFIIWAEGRTRERVIDRVNIFEATKLAMLRALRNLFQKFQKVSHSQPLKINQKKCFLILDGTIKLDCGIMEKSMVRADQKVFSVACASIIAKVRRDQYMIKLHQKFPEYGFNQNKGYGTKFHIEIIKKQGLSNFHRKTFCSFC